MNRKRINFGLNIYYWLGTNKYIFIGILFSLILILNQNSLNPGHLPECEGTNFRKNNVKLYFACTGTNSCTVQTFYQKSD